MKQVYETNLYKERRRIMFQTVRTTKEGDAKIITSPSQILLQNILKDSKRINELQSRNTITTNIVINISTK